MRFRSGIGGRGFAGGGRARAAFFLVSLSFWLGACDATDPAAAPEPELEPIPAARPSVFLLTIDTLRADHLGAYGHPENASPEIDAWAQRGLLFERAIAASSRTAPSHASMMTSRSVRRHTIQHGNGSTRLGDQPTLARILKAEGYATAAFVSNSVLDARTGFGVGFDVYDDALDERERNRLVFERGAEATAARALEWLADAPQPFFLWVHLNDPHGPYTPAPEAAAAFEGRPPGPESAASRKAADSLPVLGVQRGYRGIPAYQALPGLNQVQAYRARYLAEIRAADAQAGRLARAAKTAAGEGGLVAALTADHGESFGENEFYFSHGYATTPDLVHVPLIFWAPGLSPGRSAQPAHHIDLLPTLLGLAGIAPGFVAEGIDLARGSGSGERAAPAGSAAGAAIAEERVLFADVGEEVSAYRGRQVLRMRVAEDLPGLVAGDSRRIEWASASDWREQPGDAAAGADPRERELVDALADYLSLVGSYILAPPPDDRLTEQLRALGYVEPDPGASSGTGERPVSD